MKFNPKTVTLKNRKEVRIRTAEISDAENLLATLKKYISDSAFIPKTSNEIISTVEQERDWISSFIQKDNSLLLVAEFENEIIGNIDLTGNPRIMMQHTAIIGMGMLTDWRNVGLGTEFMKSSIDWAKENPMLELLLLQVYCENISAIYLYKKMGFKENGIVENYFKNGAEYHDNLMMSLVVK